MFHSFCIPGHMAAHFTHCHIFTLILSQHTAMTQDQGTKLEGMFTGGLQHWSSMDDQLESVSEKMDTAEGHLARIAENTGVSAGHLGELKEVIKKMIRDGLKVK